MNHKQKKSYITYLAFHKTKFAHQKNLELKLYMVVSCSYFFPKYYEQTVIGSCRHKMREKLELNFKNLRAIYI